MLLHQYMMGKDIFKQKLKVEVAETLVTQQVSKLFTKQLRL